MRYLLDGSVFTADPNATLGRGSEGVVIESPRDPGSCLKLFHEADPSDPNARKIAAYRSRKIRAICARDIHLPPQFILPQRPVYDADTGRQIIGFQMQRLPAGHQKLIKLLDANFRASHQVGLRMVAELFACLFEDLALIHSAGFVIGDLNLGCVMFEPGKGRAWVDTDSWSYEDFPCLATTEMFAHPDLYGNLSASGNRVQPAPHHDRFSLLIALSLLAIPGAHPFRMGSHPTVKGLQNRTNAGLTVFDAGVTFPKMLGSPDILSDTVLHELVRRLKRITDAPLDPTLLRDFAQEITSCKTCGADFHASRKNCPKCNQATVIQAGGLANFSVAELYRALGTVLFAQYLGTDLYLVCRQGNQTYVARVEESGTGTILDASLPSMPGARYRFFEGHLVVCPSPRQEAPAQLLLYRIEGDSLHRVNDTSTGVLKGGAAMFDTSSRFLYRTAGNALVRCQPFGLGGALSEQPIAEVFKQQSWFTVDRTPGTDHEVIFGYDRGVRDWQWFVVLGNAKGSRYQRNNVQGLHLRAGESVEDFAVYFSGGSVLLAMLTSHHGRSYARYAKIGFDGTVQLEQIVNSSDETYPLWTNLRGKMYQGPSILHVTPTGIVKQTLANQVQQPLGIDGQLAIDDQLLRLGGRVGIVRRNGVYTLASNR